MNLFYAPLLNASDSNYTFDKDESRHIAKVLRKTIGDKIFLTNGKGGWFQSVVVDNNPKKTSVQIEKYTFKEPQPYKVHIAMAPTKSNDRFEWFLEKATELGLNEVTPLLTVHSERKKINKKRYDKVVTAAMKQSLQAYKPKVNDLQAFKAFLKQDFSAYQKLIAYCKADKPILSTIQPEKNILLLIGPEGGFSEEEFALALASGFEPVLLSPNRLRTETAGVTGVAAINLKNS